MRTVIVTALLIAFVAVLYYLLPLWGCLLLGGGL